MDTFYLEPDKFWDIFHKPDVDSSLSTSTVNKSRPSRLAPKKSGLESIHDDHDDSYGKRLKVEEKKPRILAETEAAIRCDSRYIIMWGPHKPGKKNKVWEGDGYLSLIGQMAHVSDLKGRLLEDPTILDDVDLRIVEDMGELMIGNTEIQIVESDVRK